MKLGIKVNADSESRDRLTAANPDFAEVWFNINEKERYTALFDDLKKRGCEAGLHFWGSLKDEMSPNIAYPDKTVTRKSMDLMRQTIDIASKHKFSYVNIHPGAAALFKVNYTKERFDIVSDPVEMDTAIQTFLLNASILSNYAKARGVILTVETVPSRATNGWYKSSKSRQPKNIFELPASALIAAAQNGIWVANDFSHTAANVISDSADVVWTYLLGTTKLMASQTRLIHIGFVVPPYNGLDTHDTLANPILNTSKAVPNKQQMIELLKLFAGRDDVYILAEPRKDHVGNYKMVKKLIEAASRK